MITILSTCKRCGSIATLKGERVLMYPKQTPRRCQNCENWNGCKLEPHEVDEILYKRKRERSTKGVDA